MANNGWMSLLWFIAVIAMIPVVLWLFKRTPLGGAGSNALMRHVSVLPLSPSQRVVTVEVGQGEDRRWLVLGVTPQSITTLHTMAPQSEVVSASAVPPFAQVLAKLRRPSEVTGAR